MNSSSYFRQSLPEKHRSLCDYFHEKESEVKEIILTFSITMDSSDSDRWMGGFLLRPLFGGCCLLRPLLDALLAATFSLQGLRWLPTL